MPRAHRRRSNINSAFRPPTPRPPATGDSPALLVSCPDDTVRKALEYWPSVVDRPLFVYFVQEEDGGPVKIGQAQNPLVRLTELQTGNPRRLTIRALVVAAVGTERSLHLLWGSTARIRGEWFGDGHEDRILELARQASAAQIDSHRSGTPIYRVAEVAHEISPQTGTWVK